MGSVVDDDEDGEALSSPSPVGGLPEQRFALYPRHVQRRQ